MNAYSGALAASIKLQNDQNEEEKMTNYNNEDLNNWEFKILRANNISGFKNANELKKVLDEESTNGWELLEKFDNRRLRFKRRRTSTENNSLIDPYRTVYGWSEEATIIAIVLGFIVLPIIGVIVAAIIYK